MKSTPVPSPEQNKETCICPAGPEARKAMMQRMFEWPDQRFNKHNDNILDHRCLLHGERAQPAVWGRHKELQLTVTWLQWESLSVEKKDGACDGR